MGDYLTIYFGSSTAGPKAVEWDNCMVVGDGSSVLNESTVYSLTSSDWSTLLVDAGFAAGDTIYDSVGVYFASSPTPQNLIVYAHVDGATTTYLDVPLQYVSGNIWEIPIKPPTDFVSSTQKVKFYNCATETTGIGTDNYADGSAGIGFTVNTDGAGNWTGQVTFDDGLSGTSGIAKPLTYDCKVTADFTAGTSSGLSEALEEYNINMLSLALENDSTIEQYTDNVFGTSQLDDMMTMLNAIAGKNCLWFYALPGGAQPETVITGAANKWRDLKSLLGARSDVVAIKIIPSALNQDMATGYMSMTAISHPHQQLTFAEPHMGILNAEPKVNRGKWNDGQIASIMKRTELQGNPYLVTYGFTFGSGDAARINGIRCRNILAQSLINNLWGLLARRDTLMSTEGVASVKATIKATFKILIDQRIIDGLVSINVPIEQDLKNNTEAGQLARAQRTIPAVEIEYLWYTSVEKIIITRAENVAT